MKTFFGRVLAVVVGIILVQAVFGLLFFLMLSITASSDAPQVKSNSLLVTGFSSRIADRANENPMSWLMSGSPFASEEMGLNQILKDLDKAAKDDHIKGIFLKMTTVSAGYSTSSEIRDALIDFKESGKFIYAYADAYTEKSYYLASVADSIFMTPEGIFLFGGIGAQINFYKKGLDKLGIDVQVVKHGSYKSAAESFTRESLSEENREQIETYVGAVWDQITEQISQSRDIPVEEINRIADELETIDPDKLIETGMVDGLIYYDEFLALCKEKMGVEEKDDINAITLKKYKDVPSAKKSEFSRNKIAVIYAMGTVVNGNAGEGFIGSERIARAIRKARRDKNVKAIVLRINSGGGSAVASDVVCREVKLAAEAKPLVASLGDVAASGGYYIAAPADTILANPTSITGSIGVVFTLPDFSGFMNEKLGISTDEIKTNKNANILSISDPLDPAERVLIQRMVDNTYDAFLEVVADGRGMSVEEVDDIGGGRVWAAPDALREGLIDMYGGLEKSIEVASELAGLENYRVQSLPKLEDPLTQLMKELTGASAQWTDKQIRRELGPNYIHYKTLREVQDMKGVQAIMPFQIDLR